MNWYLEALRKYAVLDGRARRAEYWWFTLINIVIVLALFYGAATVGRAGMLALVYIIAMIIPFFAVSVRRLHDTNRTGWWLLLTFVPVGDIILLIFFALDSTPGANKYGPDPKGVS